VGLQRTLLTVSASRFTGAATQTSHAAGQQMKLAHVAEPAAGNVRPPAGPRCSRTPAYAGMIPHGTNGHHPLPGLPGRERRRDAGKRLRLFLGLPRLRVRRHAQIRRLLRLLLLGDGSLPSQTTAVLTGKKP
jgi:hypothetical protein